MTCLKKYGIIVICLPNRENKCAYLHDGTVSFRSHCQQDMEEIRRDREKRKITETKESGKEREVDNQVYATPFIYSCALVSATLAIISVTDKEFRGMRRME